jgi:hypothetical protein
MVLGTARSLRKYETQKGKTTSGQVLPRALVPVKTPVHVRHESNKSVIGFFYELLYVLSLIAFCPVTMKK